MFVTELSSKFINSYKSKTPPWGPVGYVVYKRTYARKVEAEKRTEEWFETVGRAVNGILKIGGKFTEEETKSLYDYVFNLKGSFSGRALWQLGTKTVDKIGGDSMMNCWCCNVNHPIDPFCFVFNELMLGGGVGYNIQAENVFEIPKVKHDVNIVRLDEKDVDFVVPDNREGWVELLRKVLNSFFFTGKSFSYSTICIRGKGAAIKSFGGTASGPEDLCWGIDNICSVLKERVGKKMRPIDCLDVLNIIGKVVVAGNVRRSAQIALGDVSDYQYFDAKNFAKGSVPNWRSMSNNSVICNKFEYLHERFWSGYNGEGEAYGLVNLKNCRKFGRLADGQNYRPDPKIMGTNPCLTGSTLVYVADGRGNVPIKQLAEEGKDVPVFCLDENKNVVARTMRHPRITGYSSPVVKVTLEDGLVLRVTPNHKFLTTDGDYKQAKDLVIGNGLRTLTRYEASIKDIFPKANSRSQDYWWVSMGFKSTKSEHRIISEFKIGRKIKTGEVVHHKDRNGKNNSPLNLELMSRKSHDLLHGSLMTGDNNPMRRARTEWSEEKWSQYKENMSVSVKEELNGKYCGQTNDDLKRHALALTKKLSRRFSKEEWDQYAKENGLPLSFSKWRKYHLRGIVGLAKWAALECGFDSLVVNLDPRTVKFYQELCSQGYDCYIDGKEVYINKKCENCRKDFVVHHGHREVAYCSKSCSNKVTWKDEEKRKNRKEGMRKTILAKRDILKEKQIKVFLDLKFLFKREPMKKEWASECKSHSISPEMLRESSPFRFWDDLKEAAANFNHKVISIETDGEEDVYNGTVDEYHNFFIGAFDGKTANGKHKSLYVNNLQCGEIPLEPYESCNLAEIFLPNIKDENEFVKVAELMYKVVKTISTLRFINDHTNEVAKRNHRLGIGVTGFLQAEHLRKPEIFTKVYKHIESVDKTYSKIIGVKESVKLTTCKPSGTLSLLAGVTPGVHPAYSPYYIRRIRMASDDSLVSLCVKNGYHVEPQRNYDGSPDRDTMVVSFPVKSSENAICAQSLNAIQQLEWVKWLQTYWADNSVSVTVYYKKEELPEIKTWLKENYDESIKSVSFLLHSDHGFNQAPLEAISKETYDKVSASCKQITHLEDKEVTGFASALECDSGSCPIK